MSSYTGPPGGQPPVPSDHVSIHCLRCNAYGPAVPILPPPHPSLATGHATEYHAECEDCLSARGVIRPANSANFPSTPRTSSSVRASRRTPPRAGELGPPRTLQPDPGVQYPVRPWELVHCSHDSLQSAMHPPHTEPHHRRWYSAQLAMPCPECGRVLNSTCVLTQPREFPKATRNDLEYVQS
jgi:hypothetical protein